MPGTAASRTARARNWAHSRVDDGQRPETTKPDNRRSAPPKGDTSTFGCDMTTSFRSCVGTGSDGVGLTCLDLACSAFLVWAGCGRDRLAHKTVRVPAA